MTQIPDFSLNPLPGNKAPEKVEKVTTDATFVIIDGVKYTIGDKVWKGLSFDTPDEVFFSQGYVAFGEFEAEIYECYGFFVANKKGEQVSEAGLTSNYRIVDKFRKKYKSRY